MADESSVGDFLARLMNILSKLCAFILLCAYIFFALNANFNFLHNEIVDKIVHYIMYYGPLVIVSLVCIEFAINKNILLQILIYALLAIMIIFQFFPDTWHSIISSIPTGGTGK